MPVSQYQEWKNLSPLLYSYLSTIELKDFKAVSIARFSKCEVKSSSFKYSQHKTIICGKSHANNGLLTINQLLLPLPKDLDDTRLRNKLNIICSHQFESEVTLAEECIVAASSIEETSKNTFLLICQKNYPQIMVYSMDGLEEAAKDKLITVNPRIRLKGHQTEITALKNRKNEIISGNRKGQLLIHSMSGHTQAENVYRYHRQMVTDCCWLSQDQRQDKLFASCSLEGLVYIWDRRTAQPSCKILPKQGQLYCLYLLKDNCFLSGGKDGTIKFWDIRNSANRFFTYNEHSSPVSAITKLGSGQTHSDYAFVSGSQSGEILLWEYQAQFSHLHHQHEIKDISYEKTIDMLMSVDAQGESICLWKPALRGQTD